MTRWMLVLWNTAQILKQICFMRHWPKKCWNHHFCRSKRRMNRSRQFNHRGPGIHRARSPSEQGPRQLGLRNLGPLAAFLGGKKKHERRKIPQASGIHKSLKMLILVDTMKYHEYDEMFMLNYLIASCYFVLVYPCILCWFVSMYMCRHWQD